MEQAQTRFLNLPLATDVESAKRQLRQHQEIKQGKGHTQHIMKMRKFRHQKIAVIILKYWILWLYDDNLGSQ